MGGTAYAANTVASRDVIDDSLESRDLRNNAAVRSPDVVDDNVTGGGLVGTDIRNEALTSSDVSALTGADVNDGSLSGADLAGDAVGTAKLQNFGVTTGKLASDAVTREKLGFKAVDQSAMANDSVASAEIVGSTVRAQELGAIADRTAVGRIEGTGLGTQTADCATGEQVISGGLTGIDGRIGMVQSFRSDNGWTVMAKNGSNQLEFFTVHAYCLVP